MLPGTFAALKTSNLVTNTDIMASMGKMLIISFWHTVPAAQKTNLITNTNTLSLLGLFLHKSPFLVDAWQYQYQSCIGCQ
jgi:hypothetical protein